MPDLTRRGLLVLGGAATLAACSSASGPNPRTKASSSGVTRRVEPYGTDPLQIGEWFVPDGDGLVPTVVLVHGGFWSPQYDRHLEDKVALDLADRGYLCWNVNYRSAASPWPATLTDAAAAYDHLYIGAFAHRIDVTKVAVVGHSAGGQLAGWLASRHLLEDGAPGYHPKAQPPALCIPQAGVLAMKVAAHQNLGGGAVQQLIGGDPAQLPDRYAEADPIELLPSGVRSVAIHDRADDIVPVSQSQLYTEAAVHAGDDSTLVLTSGDHFSHIDPTSEACARMRDALATL
ncbi:MAG TPA: alpha/beta hydrolase [Mycobacteriales bacterium]|nr:alpha/beta hydrolase [Mycobacteriales bacterium]